MKMAVDEAYQGHGIGRMLMKAGIEHARQCKARAVKLETKSKLKAAIHLYRELGFKLVETTTLSPCAPLTLATTAASLKFSPGEIALALQIEVDDARAIAVC